MMTGNTTTAIIQMLTTADTNKSYDNELLDVVRKGCFQNFNTIACVRNGVLAFMAVFTGVLCIIKIARLHVRRHQTCHQFTVFYCAVLECTLGAVHWVIGQYLQMDFMLQYLKLIQFLVMCHFYGTLATRALRKESLTRKVLVPILLFALVYFTVIVTMGMVNVQSSWIECFQPYWLELSLAELLLAQLFMVAGVYITRRLNEISTLDSVRWQQKRDLWCIIIVFEFSAMVAVIYDFIVVISYEGCHDLLFNQSEKPSVSASVYALSHIGAISSLAVWYVINHTVGDEENGCSGIFLHTQELYSIVNIFFTTIKLLLPIWVMLLVFQPMPATTDQQDLLPAHSEDGTFTSVFSPTIDDLQYRQLYQPADCYQSLEDSPSPPGGITTQQSGGVPVYPGLSRTGLVNRIPSLHPISEESKEFGKELCATPPSLSTSPAVIDAQTTTIQTKAVVGGVAKKTVYL